MPSQGPEQVHGQVPQPQRCENPRAQLGRALLAMHSQHPFSKYTVPLLVHTSGTVAGDNYVCTHPGWLFNYLITRAILTYNECLKFQPRLPTPKQCTHNGSLPPFDPAAITGVIGDMIAKRSIQIESHNVARMQGQNTLFFTEDVHHSIITCLRHCYPAEHFMLQNWLHAKFQLESLQFYSEHYPQSRRVEQPIYAAAPFLQGTPGQNLFPSHSHFYQPFPHQPVPTPMPVYTSFHIPYAAPGHEHPSGSAHTAQRMTAVSESMNAANDMPRGTSHAEKPEEQIHPISSQGTMVSTGPDSSCWFPPPSSLQTHSTYQSMHFADVSQPISENAHMFPSRSKPKNISDKNYLKDVQSMASKIAI